MQDREYGKQRTTLSTKVENELAEWYVEEAHRRRMSKSELVAQVLEKFHRNQTGQAT